MHVYDVVIVGAGPSGLITALEARKFGKKVLILEKMHRAALKLRITGKGRCNLTNDMELKAFVSRFGKNGRFLRYAFSKFFNADLLTYFEKLGVRFQKERGGRYFPMGNDANQVADALVDQVKQSGSELRVRCDVKHIKQVGDHLFEVQIKKGGQTEVIKAKNVVLATGGKSYPKTGSAGAGYEFAKQLGHTVTPLYPALVPLETKESFVKNLQGLLLKNINGTIWADGKKITELFGEMTFSDFGVSGPIIISFSKAVIQLLENGSSVQLKVDLKPALEHKKLDNRLVREIDEHPKKKFDFLLKKLLPIKLIPVFCERLQIDSDRQLNRINAEDRKKLRMMLKEFTLEISGYRSYEHAIVTSGGVSVKEVEQKTMESKKIKGLYLVGELLDLDADTGGYNLQAAFSTGWLAGRSVSDETPPSTG